MKILVTGANGFIGSAFCTLALGNGHEVAGLVRRETVAGNNQGTNGSMTCLVGKLEAPPWDAIQAFAPEVCLHAAWLTTPDVYLQAPENELYFKWSLAFLRQLAQIGVHYFAVLGTCLEYEPGPAPRLEDRTRLAPTTSYAQWKNSLRLALEDELITAGATLGWGRVFYPYGVGEHPRRLCSSIIHALSRGEPIVLKTPHSTKDYIYIEDLAQALLLLIERRFAGPTNLGTGQGVTVVQLARALAELVGRPDLVSLAEAQQTPDPFACVVADTSRLRSLGWKPQVSLHAGLRRLLEHLNQ
jgi:dTDP-6-deoxy-L-talose 4-dehydrogenase (NAD+)